LYQLIKFAFGRCIILRNKILYDLCKNCNKKNCDHTSTEVDDCKKSLLENKGNKRNWPEEIHKRQLAFFNAIPEEGTISEYDHILKFPYGPSVYRDTKRQTLKLYKKFIVHNKIASTYARVTTVQEKII